jgi:hypothetical protein
MQDGVTMDGRIASNVSPFQASRQRIGEIELCGWLSQAEPGETLEYHRGFLGIDRTPLGQPMSLKDRLDLIAMAGRAMRLAEQGLVHLVQRRIGDDAFSYLAVARSRPAGAALSFSALSFRRPHDDRSQPTVA